ncbi:MAG: AAA family ATPase [Thermomicrobiales bacterium]
MSDPLLNLPPLAAPPNAYTLDLVQPERVRWLSRGRLAAGKITVLEGDPGLGKSTLLCEWAARISRGEALPDGEPGSPRGVLLLSAEDGLADTIRPRLDAAGADVERIVALVSISDGSLEGRPPTIPGDRGLIEQMVTEIDAALVVIDPLVAYLDGQLNAYRDQDTRRALASLAGLAERTGAAILLVRHLTKTTGGPALYRGGGSIGIIGAARCGLLLAADPDDPTVRVLAPTKGNLAFPPPSLAFRLDPIPDGDAARLVWLGESKRRADDLVNPPDPKARTERDEAKDWLRLVLADGPMAARRVEEKARREGIAPKTLRKAREDVQVVTQRKGFGAGASYAWRLPDAAHLRKTIMDAPSPVSRIHGAHDAHDIHGEDEGGGREDGSPSSMLAMDAMDAMDAMVPGIQEIGLPWPGRVDEGVPTRLPLPDTPAPWEFTVPVTCLDCGAELPPGSNYYCASCAA